MKKDDKEDFIKLFIRALKEHEIEFHSDSGEWEKFKSNIQDKESMQLTTISKQYSETKNKMFKKIVKELGVPEIYWGQRTECNNETVDELHSDNGDV